jgi:hypothetical protein
MKTSFHYHTVKILAINAGMTELQAETIAYASQFVDDCCDGEPVQLKKGVALPTRVKNSLRYDAVANKFDPTCTGTSTFNSMWKSVDRAFQLKVLVSFHFIPNEKPKGNDGQQYITQQKGNLISNLVESIKAMVALDRDSVENLIKLGIALHTYADTWSHQGFCGIDSEYNGVNDLQYSTGKRWVNDDSILTKIPINIGHARVLSYPDETKREWNYDYSHFITNDQRLTSRQNYSLFLDAAKSIFNILTSITKKPIDFGSVKAPLLKSYTTSFDDAKVCKTLANSFKNISFTYDSEEWKKKALDNGDEKWFIFNEMALNQRNFVLNYYNG